MSEEIITVNDGAAITVTKARTISESVEIQEQVVERLRSKYRTLSEDLTIAEALDRATEKTRIIEQITAISEELRAYKNDVELVPPTPEAPPPSGNIIGFRRVTVTAPRRPKEPREIREVRTPEQKVYCPIAIPAFTITEQIIKAYSPIALIERLQDVRTRIALSSTTAKLSSPIAIQVQHQQRINSRLQLEPIEQKTKARIQLDSGQQIQQVGSSDILSAEILRFTKLVKLYLLANGIEPPRKTKINKGLAKQKQFVKLARLFFMAEQID